MNDISYLTKRRGIFFFRRRVPGLSTCLRPVIVSLGTTDRKQALRICVGLTAYMDLMLDDDLHISLPEADVSAFFKAELRCYLRSLKAKRIVEHVDGSMTSAKARRNNLEAVVLNGLSEDGLRKEIPQARLAALSPVLPNEAAYIQRAKYSEFISVEFNQGVEKRARRARCSAIYRLRQAISAESSNRRPDGSAQRFGGRACAFC
jgi:hypothetical protein